MTNKQHKHADVLRAIADGVHLFEFEYRYYLWKDDFWETAHSGVICELLAVPDEFKTRRKLCSVFNPYKE